MSYLEHPEPLLGCRVFWSCPKHHRSTNLAQWVLLRIRRCDGNRCETTTTILIAQRLTCSIQSGCGTLSARIRHSKENIKRFPVECTARLALLGDNRVTMVSRHRNDLAWDGESKRIIAVGDGKEKSVSASCSTWCIHSPQPTDSVMPL
jgi:hypothetical protein